MPNYSRVNKMVTTPRILANRLLESDEDYDLDVQAAINRATDSGVPGIELERQGNHWNVYKTTNVNGSRFNIGEIYANDMTDAPKDVDPSWYDARWIVLPPFPAEPKAVDTFEQAVQHLTDVYSKPWKPVRESEDPDDPEEGFKRYTDPLALTVQNANGRWFKAVITFEHDDDAARPQPMVVFSGGNDPAHPEEDEQPDDDNRFSYYASSIAAHPSAHGLDLHGGYTEYYVDADAIAKVQAWLHQELVVNRHYTLVKDGIDAAYESVDPEVPAEPNEPDDLDDPVYALNAKYDRPEEDELAGSIRIMLWPYYGDDVVVSSEKARYVPSTWNLRIRPWKVQCLRKNGQLPLPQFYNTRSAGGTSRGIYHSGTNGSEWRAQVKAWFDDWASKHDLYIKDFRISGRLRKDPTFTFDTWPLREGRPVNESADAELDDPAANLPIMLNSIDWEPEMRASLWQFHPYGVQYRVYGTPKTCIVTASTYFPPDKDDFTNRLRDHVVKTLTDRQIMPVTENNLYTSEIHNRPKDMPEWIVMVLINCKFPEPAVSAMAVSAPAPPAKPAGRASR